MGVGTLRMCLKIATHIYPNEPNSREWVTDGRVLRVDGRALPRA